MKIQIIVTTMHQTDFSILEKMNISTDVIVANQADRNAFDTKELAHGKALMVTTATRGLSKNRNIGLEFVDKDTDFVMFADDDLVFEDGYFDMVKAEIGKHPEADAIKFNLFNISKTRKIAMKDITEWKRATRRSLSSSGVWGAVIRKNCLDKYNVRFSEYFGTGTANYCGEDTIFFQNLLSKGVRVYMSPVTVSGIDQTESTWFEGFTEKYFTVAGKVLAAIFPAGAKLLALRSAYRFNKRKDVSLSITQIFKAYCHGIDEYKSHH